MTTMKITLLIFGLFISSLSFAQTPWNNFIKLFPTLEIPFTLDARIIKYDILISRNDAWKYIIKPATGINEKKGNVLFSVTNFPIDSQLIYEFHQWDNKDLSKRDTIDTFSPLVGYRISGLAKFKIYNNYHGIIWFLSQGKEINYSLGVHSQLWLFVYNKTGEVIDFIQLNGFSGGWDMCLSCKSHSIGRIYNIAEMIKIKISTVSVKPINEMEYEKTSKIHSDTTFTILNSGLIK